MQNKAMQRKLQKRECVDLSKCERTVTGDYVVPPELFNGEKDYCNAETEAWIWSFGRLKYDLPSVMADDTRRLLLKGTILAAETPKWHDNAVCECLWLR